LLPCSMASHARRSSRIAPCCSTLPKLEQGARGRRKWKGRVVYEKGKLKERKKNQPARGRESVGIGRAKKKRRECRRAKRQASAPSKAQRSKRPEKRRPTRPQPRRDKNKGNETKRTWFCGPRAERTKGLQQRWARPARRWTQAPPRRPSSRPQGAQTRT
jgi:hypothetical protein